MNARFPITAVAISLFAAAACSSSNSNEASGADIAGDDAGSAIDAAVTSTSDAAALPVDASRMADSSPDAAKPTVLGTTDGTVATGWYCGKNGSLLHHLASFADPTLEDPNNLFYVDKATSTVRILGYCTHGCNAGTAAHDECVAPSGTPVNGRECFGGAGKYCGHVLGIEARSFPKVTNAEGLFSCDATSGVTLDANCACQVVPGGADECVPPGGGRKLWIAYETAATCAGDLTDFFHCMLERTNFTSLALSYGTGYSLAWGGIAQVPAGCATDYQCAIDAAHFAVRAFDVVLIVKGGGIGGQNNWDPIVQVGGKPVHIHGAFIGDASGNCDMQTAYAMHEVYEATSDPGSGDCCDGEVPYTPAGASGCLAWNSAASIACAKWGPSSCGGDGSYGLARIQCGAKSYMYQRVSPANDEYGFGANTCLTIQVTH